VGTGGGGGGGHSTSAGAASAVYSICAQSPPRSPPGARPCRGVRAPAGARCGAGARLAEEGRLGARGAEGGEAREVEARHGAHLAPIGRTLSRNPHPRGARARRRSGRRRGRARGTGQRRSSVCWGIARGAAKRRARRGTTRVAGPMTPQRRASASAGTSPRPSRPTSCPPSSVGSHTSTTATSAARRVAPPAAPASSSSSEEEDSPGSALSTRSRSPLARAIRICRFATGRSRSYLNRARVHGRPRERVRSGRGVVRQGVAGLGWAGLGRAGRGGGRHRVTAAPRRSARKACSPAPAPRSATTHPGVTARPSAASNACPAHSVGARARARARVRARRKGAHVEAGSVVEGREVPAVRTHRLEDGPTQHHPARPRLPLAPRRGNLPLAGRHVRRRRRGRVLGHRTLCRELTREAGE
jgi:hypothetical protein